MTTAFHSDVTETAPLAERIEAAEAARKPRRTREQVEQDKILAAQARIDKIKADQRIRLIMLAYGHVEKAMTLLADLGVKVPQDEFEMDAHEVCLSVRVALCEELAK